MSEAEPETPTSWKQLRVKTNLGTLASVAVVLGAILYQGIQIQGQITSNSDAVDSLATTVEELTGAVSLATAVDTRQQQLFSEIENLRAQYQDQADVWIEISTQAEQIDTIRTEARILRTDIESTWNQQNEFRMEVVERVGEFEAAGQTLSALEWQVDDIERRLAEMVGGDNAGVDITWQVTDLVRQVAEIQGRQNAGVDLEWKLEDLENGFDWEIDELTRQLTDLRVRVETSGGVEQWQVDDLYGVTDELFDMVWRMWAALESRSWPAEYLYD